MRSSGMSLRAWLSASTRTSAILRYSSIGGFGTIMSYFVAIAGSSGLFVAALRRRRRVPVTVVVEALSPLALAPGDNPYTEEHIPRWRRPSLQAARTHDERLSVEPAAQLAFREPTANGTERRRVRYRIVRMSDAPDEVRSKEIGQLEMNDEVEVLERYARFVMVRTPLGTEGWLHITTLGPPLGPNGEELPEGSAEGSAEG